MNTRNNWVFLLPYLSGTLILVVIPLFIAITLAFFRYDALSKPVWVGVSNFQLIAVDPLTHVALFNSLFFALLAVPLRLLLAFGLALFYWQSRPGSPIYRAIACLPSIIPDTAYALLWLWILNPLYGPLNTLLAGIGLHPPAWLVDYQWSKPGLVLMWSFQVAEGFVLLLAALKHLPTETLDAARVDGAGGFRLFKAITFPLVMPWLLLLAVRDTILSLQNSFAPAMIMTGGEPYYATFFAPLLIYEEAFDRLRFGQGMAIMLIVIGLTTALVLMIYWLLEGRGEFENL